MYRDPVSSAIVNPLSIRVRVLWAHFTRLHAGAYPVGRAVAEITDSLW